MNGKKEGICGRHLHHGVVPYNYRLQEARDVLFPLCKALNIGVVVMKPFCWPHYGLSFIHLCPIDCETGGFTPSQTSLKWILNSPEVSTVVPGANTMAELEENLAIFIKEFEIDEEILEQCLEVATSLRGQAKLRELCEDEEIARTRPDIRGYAMRALKQK